MTWVKTEIIYFFENFENFQKIKFFKFRKKLKILKIENFDSRFKLIVADRDQNFGGHSKYRSRAFQQFFLK